MALILTVGAVSPVAAADFDRIDDFYAAYGENLPSNPVHFTRTAKSIVKDFVLIRRYLAGGRDITLV